MSTSSEDFGRNQVPRDADGEPADLKMDDSEHVSLCEALDRVLNKGAVVVGELTISVANIDLIYVGLQVILTSIESARATAERSGTAIGITTGQI